MEIKGRKILAPSDTRPLKEIARAIGKEWRAGLVIYQGNAIKKIGEPNIWAIPSKRLFI
jgi:hypothetical protein